MSGPAFEGSRPGRPHMTRPALWGPEGSQSAALVGGRDRVGLQIATLSALDNWGAAGFAPTMSSSRMRAGVGPMSSLRLRGPDLYRPPARRRLRAAC